MKRVCMLLSISGLLLMPRTAEAQTADTLQGSYQALPDRSNTHFVATATQQGVHGIHVGGVGGECALRAD